MLRVARWHGALVAALFASSLGLYVGNHVFFLLATVPLAYVIYGLLTGLGPPSLSVSRAVSREHTDPGTPLTVRLTVQNTGDRPIPDLRVLDTVPDDVTVVDGSPTACVALRPDEAVTLEYDVLPTRGTHEFGSVLLRGRSLAGTVVGTTELDPDGTEQVVCDTLLEQFPLQDQTTPYAGMHPTDDGGRGVEFHEVREYRRGDPMSQIDWNRLARTGDLATVNFREERAASVVFVIDERNTVALRSPQGGPSATDLSIYAAAQGFVTLTGTGHEVGLTTLSPIGAGDWVPPGRGDATEAAAADLFQRLQGDAGDQPVPGAPPSRDADTTARTDGDDGPSVATDGAGDDGTGNDGTGTAGADRSGDAAGVGFGAAGDGADSGSREWDTDTVDGRALGLRLAERLPSHTQVVLCTPLVDDVPIEVAETLLANRHAVTVLSPDVTRPAGGGDPTPGQAVMDLSRRTRLHELTALGIPTTDWRTDQALQVAMASMLAGHRRRWQS
jgi:uncharacterized repeat protein (TIGR01451 family)